MSPRSQVAFSLDERLMEEKRKKIEEAKRKARDSNDVSMPSTGTAQSAQPTASSAAGPSATPQSALNSVSPELLTELRKIIRDEFEQLNKGSAKENVGDKTPRPAVCRDRPTSPIQPLGSNQPASTFPSGNSEHVKTSPLAGEPSPTKTQQRPSPKQSTVRFSDETKPAVAPRTDEPRRPSPAASVELTAIDKKWGVLFEPSGTHTKRMEHVVRGLANYIIEEFLPPRSIVIPPEKMAAFYSHHKLDKERFPLAALFRSKSKSFNEALATLYEDLGCQYFLVQAEKQSRPTVPSLTPDGFMQWLVAMIQAYPDDEARRLDKVVSALPIEADSLLDGKPERLPKQISRYLLPKEAVRKTRRLVDDAMQDFQEDLGGMSTSRSKGSATSSSSTTSGVKATPVVVTSTAEKRPSIATSSSHNSRYVPETLPKDSRGDDTGGGGYDRDRRGSAAGGSSRDHGADETSRRSSTAAPSAPSKLSRSGSVAEGVKSGQSSRDTYGSSTGGTASRGTANSSSSRKNRSPQRNPHSQSAPVGLDRDERGSDRHRSSGSSAHTASGPGHNSGSYAQSQPSQNPSSSAAAADGSSRDPRGNGDPYRTKRVSIDDSIPRAPASTHGLRDKVDFDLGGSTSRSSKRRSMVMPDVRGPTWDDYLKSSAPRSATPSLSRRDVGYGSSG